MHTQSITLYVHPVLILHTAYESLQADRVEIAPRLKGEKQWTEHWLNGR
jgi:hypothetical protein